MKQQFAQQLPNMMKQHFVQQLLHLMSQQFAYELPNHHPFFFNLFPLAIATFNIKKKTIISMLIINSNELNQKDKRKKTIPPTAC
jgi:hypothetical protein